MSDSRENAKKEFPEARELSMEELSKVVGGGDALPGFGQRLGQGLFQPGDTCLQQQLILQKLQELQKTQDDMTADDMMETFSQTLQQYLQNKPQ